MQIRLRWPRHSSGYRIELGEPAANAPSTILSREPSPLYIVPKGAGAAIPNPNILAADALYRRLAECEPTPDGVLAFVDRFGLLVTGDRQEANSAARDVEAVRSLIAARDRGDLDTLMRWTENPSNRRAMSLYPALVPAARHTPYTAPVDLTYTPRDLRAAVFCQFFRDFTSSAQLRRCKRPGCPEWFQYGPGTQRRSTALYCSPSCQHADVYQRRKGALIDHASSEVGR